MLGKQFLKPLFSDGAMEEPSAKDRFTVLSTWGILAPLLSPKDFGAFKGLKEEIGAPRPILGEDVDAVLAEREKNREETIVDWSTVDFEGLDPEHPLSAAFYSRLF